MCRTQESKHTVMYGVRTFNDYNKDIMIVNNSHKKIKSAFKDTGLQFYDDIDCC